DRPDMVNAAQNAVFLYAGGIILSDTEIVIALDYDGNTAMSTSDLELTAAERERVLGILREGSEGISQALMGGEERVFTAFYFAPFGWHILITEQAHAFFRDADSIRLQALVVLGVASAAAILLLVLFARRLTNPLGRIVNAMNAITSGGDLSSRVDVEYHDETGKLASTFNLMISELEKAYGQIKRYAFDAVLAGKKEQRIRQIFQKYVPKDLIDKFFASPESMLVGENRDLAILFSDIRSFTTISESMAPNELVNSLNQYFSGQVDIIMNRNGIVDKYIGDAIMAFWGAPVKHEDDAIQALLAALDMMESVKAFNVKQKKLGKPEFHIGIGINFGTVTVGNIGSERKMDYTVIGDTVNLASRMEGLTKAYNEDVLISEPLYEAIKATPAPAIKRAAALNGAASSNSTESSAASSGAESGGSAPAPATLSFRLMDMVAVKGKTKGVKIYAAKKSLQPEEAKAWAIHNQGMELYYRRDFEGAAKRFAAAHSMLSGDFIASELLKRCRAYSASPPPPNWDGVEVMTSK
ncbi:MAG: HAMP domain-containing protein, partial [Treponema sp.]|nr:HAMP domain-containing protein [Treponema sp.]